MLSNGTQIKILLRKKLTQTKNEVLLCEKILSYIRCPSCNSIGKRLKNCSHCYCLLCEECGTPCNLCNHIVCNHHKIYFPVCYDYNDQYI